MKKLLLVGILMVLCVAAIFGWRHAQPTPVAPAAGTAGSAATLASASPAGPAYGTTVTAAVTAPVQSSPANVPAGGLTGPARRRAWDYNYLSGFSAAAAGEAVRFELVGGEFAAGTIRHVERRGEVLEIAGVLTTPEPGRFSFRKQTLPGKAGDFTGEVEFPASRTAYRIEPTGPNGTSELVERRLEEVLCLAMPAMDAAQLAASEAENMPPLDPQDVTDYVPAYNDGIISLQSLPGATGVLYMDYRGGYTPTWGGITYEKPNVSNAQIKDVWKRVAEDYMPFNINVTTDIRIYEGAPENSRQRCVLTPTTTAAPGAGGVAYIGDWNSTGDRPCWSFYSTGKSAAEVVSHEVGHTLGLGHDGRTTPDEGYYGGQGSGAVGWAPIMGVGYYQPVAQWSKGEYAYANNTQDDLNIIVSNNNSVDNRADDTGDTLAGARYLDLYANYTASAEGVIETTADTDAFRFTTAGGAVTLTANPVGDWADLALQVTLADESDTVIAANNPQTVLSASISTVLAAGTYTFRVTGAGRNDPLTDGFSAYASLGYYSVTGSVAGAVLPSRFSIAENSTNGATVGTITATNLGVDPLVYVITSGNTSNAFALDDSGLLTVSNGGVLDYEALARGSSFPVQFELFVDITNTLNPALTELNRRVVVQVLNVNEPPTVTGFTNMLIAHTQPGVVAGQVVAADPDAYSVLSLAITAGNSNGMFTLDNASGRILVAGDLNPALQSVYNLTLRVTDNGAGLLTGTANVQITVSTNASPFQPGSVSYAVYDGIGSGTLISNLTNSTKFPRDPNWEQQRTLMEGDSGRADSYGSVMRGYLIPPVSGSYTFWIATDDNGELWLSPTTNPASATVIASIAGSSSWAGSREWTKYASQKSTARALVAGQAYYIEARQKEGGGGDNLAVGWQGPATSGQTNVIAALYLAPHFLNYVPHATGFTNAVRRDTFQNAAVGRVTVTDVNTNDSPSFTLLSGNTAGLFAVDSGGWVRVANEGVLQNISITNFTLSVRVSDNGSPSLSATTSVSLNLIATNTVVATALQREMFYNIGSSTTVTSLTSNVKYPGRPDAILPFTSLATAADVADNYGSRARGYVVPSVSGSYRFFLSSDDDGQLKLSPTENPSNAVVIASVSGWSSPNEWTKYASQTSPVQAGLVAGQRYYIEVLQKEGGGGDHFEVAWLVPGSGVTNVIPAANLQPVDLNYAPQFSNSLAPVIFTTATNGQMVAVVTALDSPLDTLTYKIVSGNTGGTFAMNAASGVLTVANNALITNGTVTAFPLLVSVQDSGYGGVYPLKSVQANVPVTVVGPGARVWSGGGTVNNWSDSNNWNGQPLTANSRVVFASPVRQTNSNNAVGILDWVQFAAGGFSAAGTPLTLQSGLTNSGNNTWAITTTLGAAQTWRNTSGTLTVSGGIASAGNALTVAAESPVSLNGVLSGAGSLIKTGTNTLTLAGANSNTGGAAVNAGTLLLNHVSALTYGAAHSNLDLAAGAFAVWNNTGNTGNGTGGNAGWNVNVTGAGTFIVSNASTVLTLSGSNTFAGTWQVKAASAFVFGQDLASQGVPDLNLTGGSVVLGFNGTTTLGNLSGTGGSVAVSYNYGGAGNGLRTLSLSQTVDAAYAGVLGVGDAGDGTRQLALVKGGAATLTLSGANVFSGPTTVSGGTLLVNGSLGTNSVTVQDGARLGGTGTLGGVAIIEPGGTLAPGTTGIGRLTANGGLDLAGDALLEISANGSLTNDVVATAATVNYGGTLTVTNIGGTDLALGDQFKLFSAATYAGGFDATNLPALDAGLAWAWEPGTGTLTVVPAVSPVPVPLTATLAGDQLTFTWPADHIGWVLQVQTNSLETGLSALPASWLPVAGSSTTNVVTVTVDPAQPAAFYRMVYPPQP